MFELREINLSNWEQAVAVEVRNDQVRFVAPYEPVALVILAKCFLQPEGRTWLPFVALHDDVPVGVAAVAVGAENAQLRHVAIDRRWQGQGLGRQMVDALVATIAETQASCRSIVVTTHPENEPALALYLSAGFRRTGALSGIEPVLALDLGT